MFILTSGRPPGAPICMSSRQLLLFQFFFLVYLVVPPITTIPSQSMPSLPLCKYCAKCLPLLASVPHARVMPKQQTRVNYVVTATYCACDERYCNQYGYDLSHDSNGLGPGPGDCCHYGCCFVCSVSERVYV